MSRVLREIFLGKPLHWAIVVALVAGGWATGRARWHVIEFNQFVLGLLAVSVLALIAILATSRPGERVTRDQLEPDEAETGRQGPPGED